MPSAEKNSVDFIKGSIDTACLIAIIPPDCTEEDIALLEAYYLGSKRGYNLAKNENIEE